MSTSAPREYHELDVGSGSPLQWPLSRLYHENSKLTERRAPSLREQLDLFASDREGSRVGGAGKSYPTRPAVALPKARRRLFGARLDDTLRARRSHRGGFPRAGLRLDHLGALLDLAVGATGEAPGAEGPHLRAFPSAGGLYPLEVYVAALGGAPLEGGIHHYDAARHALARVAPCPGREDLARMIFADEEAWEHAAAAIVLTGVFDRTQAKYGERGYRFVLLEAGHAAQNLLLVAQSLGLPAIPIGGFCEDTLGEAMGLPGAKESPLYVVLLGGRD